MDSFNYDDHNVETEEEDSAIARDIRLRSMGKAFRTIELCIALFFLLWVVLRLPFSVRIFGELLRQLILLLLTPLFIFMLFGAGVGASMVKFYRVSSQNVAEDNVRTGIYENLVNIGLEVEVFPNEDMEIVMSCDYDCDQAKKPIAATCDVPDDVEKDMGNELLEVDVEVENQTETECIMEDDDVVLGKQYSSPRDLLNDADFKKTIDAFIKRQHEFLKLENRCDYHGDAEPYVYCY